MKFQIYSTTEDYNPQRLLKQYPVLNDYHFEIVEYEKEYVHVGYVKDEHGNRIEQHIIRKRKITEAYIIVESLEQLMKLVHDLDEYIIIGDKNETPHIEIYDDYRE